MDIKTFRELRASAPLEALASVENYLTGQPVDYLYLIEAGVAASESGDDDRALTLFRRSVAAHPSNSHATFMLARHLVHQGAKEQAIETLAQFLGAHGHHDNCLEYLAEIAPDIAAAVTEGRKFDGKVSMRLGTIIAAQHFAAGRIDAARELIASLSEYDVHRARLMFTAQYRAKAIKLNQIQVGGDNRVVQFWDTGAPPSDVGELMRTVREKSAQYVMLEQPDFDRLVRKHYGTSQQRFFDLCTHPAAQADVARLLYLYDEGGLYLDADMVLRNEAGLSMKYDRCILPVATNLFYPCLTNWLLGAEKNDPFIGSCIEAMGRAVTEEAFRKLTVFDITGPGLITQVFIESRDDDTIRDALVDESNATDYFGYHGLLKYKKEPSKNWALANPNAAYVPGDPA